MKHQSQMKSQQDSEGTATPSIIRSDLSLGEIRWEIRKYTPAFSTCKFVCRCSLQSDSLGRVVPTCMSSAAERTPVSGGGGVFGS